MLAVEIVFLKDAVVQPAIQCPQRIVDVHSEPILVRRMWGAFQAVLRPEPAVAFATHIRSCTRIQSELDASFLGLGKKHVHVLEQRRGVGQGDGGRLSLIDYTSLDYGEPLILRLGSAHLHGENSKE